MDKQRKLLSGNTLLTFSVSDLNKCYLALAKNVSQSLVSIVISAAVLSRLVH